MRFLLLKIKTLLVVVVMVVLPLGYFGAEKAEALSLGSLADSLLGGLGGGDAVRIVSDTSESSVTTAIQNTLSRVFGGIASGELQSINLKETVLDPIAWNMAKQLQQQMTGDLLKWLGGQLPGQNGEVPFVQNFSEHYADILDNVAGEVIFGGDLSGLCSEEENFKAKQKAFESYTESRSKQAIFSCNDENLASNNESLLTRMFKGTVNCDGNAICVNYKADKHLALTQANAIANENRALDYSKGMKPQRVCKVINDPDGKPRQLCEIVKPLSVDADTVSFQLGQVPSLQLLQMDEFNEIVSGFMTRLTNEAVTGISSLASGVDFTGVLGLSGNPDYTNLLFGADGGLAYIDSLIQDDVSEYQSFGTSPIEQALTVEQKNLALQTFIADEVGALETKTISNQETYGSCYDLPLTPELKETLDNAKVGKQIASTAITILTTLNEQYTNATDASARNSAMSVYTSYKNQGLFSTEQKNQELQLTFVDYTLKIMVDQFKYDIAAEQQSCGGPFDYNGLISSQDTQNGNSN